MTKDEQQKLNDELLEASSYGRLEEVKELIKKGAKVDTCAVDNYAETPLHVASLFGYLNMVKYLCEKAKATVDAMDAHDETPLHYAACNGHLEVVKYLCEEAHAKVEASDYVDETPLHEAAEFGHKEVVKYLFLEWNALMPIFGMFKYPELMKEKTGKETEAQSILDYFLQNKSKYKPEAIQEFKKEFLEFEMNAEDSSNLKSIVKFL